MSRSSEYQGHNAACKLCWNVVS